MHPGDDPSDSIEHLIAHGIELQGAGRHDEALVEFARALAMDPAHPIVHLLAGHSNLQLGRIELSVAHSRVAAAATPQSPLPWCNLALGLRQVGRIREAAMAAKRAVVLDPRFADGWVALGLVEHDGGALGPARENFRRALEIDPNHAAAHLSIANLDQAEGHVQAALEGYALTLRLDPTLVQAAYSRGHLFHKATGNIEAAIASYRDAIGIRGDYAIAHHNLAHALFLTGQFSEAWRESRWRTRRLQSDSGTTAGGRHYEPLTQMPPKGSRMLVLSEQGLGDVLFFLRFAPPFRDAGVILVFSGDRRLHDMLARTGLFDRIATPAEDPRAAGLPEVLVADLPLLLGEAVRAHAISPLALTADPSRLSAMRARLARLGPPPYIGLAWRAGAPKTGVGETLLKELPLETFGAALKHSRATWISIQREARPGETEAMSSFLGAPLHDLSAANEDLEELLALMAALDRYVGVSSTSVHLRAGTGGKANILVPFPYEWRWMAAGNSPWFPEMRVHRQTVGGSWDEAFAGLAVELR